MTADTPARLLLVAAVVLAPTLTAAPVPKGMKRERPSADGLWQIAEFNGDDGRVSAARTYWRIDGDRMSNGKRTPAEVDAASCRNTLVGRDPARPELMTLVFDDGGRRSRVLVLDGDTLRWAWATDPAATVTECKPAVGVYYYEFKRVKTDEK